MPKPVAIILLNWNTPQHTITCISSLLAHCNEAYFEVIVADNGSTDDSLQRIKAAFPTLTYLDNKENLGFAEGNNKVLSYSIEQGYRYSLLLNTDTVVNDDIVSPMMKYLDSHPRAAAAQPAIYWLHEPEKLWNGGSYFNPYFGTTYSKNNRTSVLNLSIRQVDWLTGCCFIVRNNVLKKTGLFNKRLFMYYEDVDLSLRIRKHGYELSYLPAVKVYHEAGVSGKLTAKTKEGVLSPIIHYYLSRNKLWFLRHYANKFCLPFILIGNIGYYMLLLFYFIVRCRWKKTNYLIKGIQEGLTVPLRSVWNTENS